MSFALGKGDLIARSVIRILAETGPVFRAMLRLIFLTIALISTAESMTGRRIRSMQKLGVRWVVRGACRCRANPNFVDSSNCPELLIASDGYRQRISATKLNASAGLASARQIRPAESAKVRLIVAGLCLIGKVRLQVTHSRRRLRFASAGAEPLPTGTRDRDLLGAQGRLQRALFGR